MVNRQEAQYFWEKQVSEDKEVRWDVFEECILCYLETKIDINQISSERISWDHYLRYLKVSNLRGFLLNRVFRKNWLLTLLQESCLEKYLQMPAQKNTQIILAL